MTFRFSRSVRFADQQTIRIMFSTTMLVVLAIAGCSGSQMSTLPSPQTQSVTTITLTPAINTESSSTTKLAPVMTETPEVRIPTRLVVWLPDEFNPQNADLAESLMKNQLQNYLLNNPNLVIDLRVKSEDQAHQILNVLKLTARHAPEVLPDVILLRAEDARAAKRLGLLPSYGLFTNFLEESDWFPYARQLSDPQTVGDCIPFAGDASVLIAENSLRIQNGQTWDDIARRRIPIAFPAADATQSFLKTLIHSNGGQIAMQDGLLQITPLNLEVSLLLYQNFINQGIVDRALLDYSTEREVRNLLEQGDVRWAILQISNWLQKIEMDAKAYPILDLEKKPVIPATGWLWCVMAAEPDRQILSATYIRWMTDPDFLREWSPAAGYLPVRQSSVIGWDDSGIAETVKKFSNEAQVFQDLGFSPEIENILLFFAPTLFDIDQNASALSDLINSQVQLIHNEP